MRNLSSGVLPSRQRRASEWCHPDTFVGVDQRGYFWGFWMQTFATGVANVCEGGCKRLREGLQTFASEMGKIGIKSVNPFSGKPGPGKDLMGNGSRGLHPLFPTQRKKHPTRCCFPEG